MAVLDPTLPWRWAFFRRVDPNASVLRAPCECVVLLWMLLVCYWPLAQIRVLGRGGLLPPRASVDVSLLPVVEACVIVAAGRVGEVRVAADERRPSIRTRDVLLSKGGLGVR